MDSRPSSPVPQQINLPEVNLYEMIGRKDAVIAALSLEVERLKKVFTELNLKIERLTREDS